LKQPSLFDAPAGDDRPPDQAARDFAVDPANHVVLEASAGTGKTRVLVDRYIRLIDAGVDPRHILAVTFTRKAAAEMRERILASLRRRATESRAGATVWAALGDRLADIQISTIDAFCFGLLREFPLEAGVDPGFEIADETEIARFANEALDLTLRAARRLVVDDENVRLLFARVKLPVLRSAIEALLDRRQVAMAAVATFVARRVRCSNSEEASAAFLARLSDIFPTDSPMSSAFLDDGPVRSVEFGWLRNDLGTLSEFPVRDAARVQQLQRRLERYFLTDSGKPRAQAARRFDKATFDSIPSKRRHDGAIKALAGPVAEALETLAVDVNGLIARGLQRVLVIAVETYERLLDEHAVLDFAGMLEKSVALLDRQEEFARSRLKLQSRYHHILVDEFQDTSRRQWQLVDRLIDAWREGEGPADASTSIFVVGDRKQSIYRFRYAEVRLLDEVARKVSALRPGRVVRQALTHSFRAVPELLAFVNAVSSEMQGQDDVDERFRYEETDRFAVPSVSAGARRDGEPVLGLVVEPTLEASARAVAAEIDRLLQHASVRDETGSRPARPDDIAILFRARTGHQYFEEALGTCGIPTYVYKGLGFFDTPEVQDVQALLGHLAAPENDLRAAELLRSRFIRISDVALAQLAPRFADALGDEPFDEPAARLSEADRSVLLHARQSAARWRLLTDRLPASELVDLVIRESAYARELRGRRSGQARENLKKVRALLRRVENRGYATAGRLTQYLETLKAGDESNAVIEAAGCVSLMTIHAAKGLEFPIVFVVNVHLQGRGRPAAFSIIERSVDDGPEVAFGTTPGTRLEDLREREELRRLLYVAMTRARDRLYFAGVVDPKQGNARPGLRSLASLFPASLGSLVVQAAGLDAAEVEWASASGTFAFRRCRAGGAIPSAPDHATERSGVPDVEELTSDRPAIGALAFVAERPATHSPVDGNGAASGRLLGTLVHRLFQRQPSPHLSHETLAALAERLVRPDERADLTEINSVVSLAAATFQTLRARDDIRDLLAEGECHYEVPFSFRPEGAEGRVVRGRIDCLVVRPDGRITVVEFKTGQARIEHRQQIEFYESVVRSMAPDATVDARIVYA
jgi:ATP-dependent helicase/nuclease subunit A